MDRRSISARLALALGTAAVLAVALSAASWGASQRPAGSAWTLKALFDRTAKLTAGNHVALVAGALRCSSAETSSGVHAAVRVTLVERAQEASAFGVGSWRGACADARWKVRIRSGNAFAPGSARGCAFGVQTRGGKVVDALLWCQTIRLVG